MNRGGKSSTKMTRTKSGGLEIDRQQEESEGAAGGLGIDTGITGMMVRGGYEMKTSIGFLVTIEEADDPKGELRKAFLKCKTGAQQKAFIDAHKDKVKLKEMTQGKKEGTSSGVEGSIGGVADIKIGSKGSTARTTKTDADGKLIESEIVGEQDSDVSAGFGEMLRTSDSRKTTATSGATARATSRSTWPTRASRATCSRAPASASRACSASRTSPPRKRRSRPV